MGKVVFQCEDSTDGIFTGIYDAWDSRVGHRNVKLEAGREYDMSARMNWLALLRNIVT